MKFTVEQRFWSHVDQTDECWLWTAATQRGYGCFSLSHRKRVYAHRYSWELINGPIPDDLTIDHRDTCPKNCVNPDHMRLATQKQNNENRPKFANNSSGFRGVFWHARVGR